MIKLSDLNAVCVGQCADMEDERRKAVNALLESEQSPTKRQRLQQEAEVELAAEPEQIPAVVLAYLQNDSVRLPFVVIWRLVQVFPALLVSAIGQQWDDAWFRERVRYEFPDAYAAAVQLGTDNMRESHAAKLRSMAVLSDARPFRLLQPQRRGQPWFLEYQRLRRMGQLFKAHSQQRATHQPHSSMRSIEGFRIASVFANSCWAAYEMYSNRPDREFLYPREYWLDKWTEPTPPSRWIDPYPQLPNAIYHNETMARKMFVWMITVETEIEGVFSEWIAMRNMETGVTLPHTEQQIARAVRFLGELREKQPDPGYASVQSLQNSAAVRFGVRWINTERYFELLENEGSNLNEALYNQDERPLQGNWLYKADAIVEFDDDAARNAVGPLHSKEPVILFLDAQHRATGPFFSVSMLQPLLYEETRRQPLLYEETHRIRTPGQVPTELPEQYTIRPEMASSMLVNIEDASLPIDLSTSGSFQWDSTPPMPLLHASGYFLHIEHQFVEKVEWDRKPVLEAISGTNLLYFEKDFGAYVLDLDELFARLSPEPPRLIASLCANCALPADLTCSRCEAHDYCSAECQRARWTLHKQQCIGAHKGPVVITAPHAYCPVPCKVARQCDCSAGRWASILHQALQAAGIESILHIAETPRAAMDFNRRRARGTEYREKLRHYMQQARIVLDIHSYPGSPERGWDRYDVVLLEDRRPTPASSRQFASATGIVLDPNGARNDIQDEAHERGLEAFLLEFNTFGNFRIQQNIIERIVKWVKQTHRQ